MERSEVKGPRVYPEMNAAIIRTHYRAVNGTFRYRVHGGFAPSRVVASKPRIDSGSTYLLTLRTGRWTIVRARITPIIECSVMNWDTSRASLWIRTRTGHFFFATFSASVGTLGRNSGDYKGKKDECFHDECLDPTKLFGWNSGVL